MSRGHRVVHEVKERFHTRSDDEAADNDNWKRRLHRSGYDVDTSNFFLERCSACYCDGVILIAAAAAYAD